MLSLDSRALFGLGQPVRPGERSVVSAPRGVIVTSHSLASQAGLRALRAGGSAVDAAVAAGAVMSVVEPHNSHLGGDAFMLVYEAKTGKVTAINASGGAPSGATPDRFASSGIPERGLAACSIPGVVHGWGTALRLFGRLPLGTLLEDAIYLADSGFPMTPRCAATFVDAMPVLKAHHASAEMYLAGGNSPRAGATFRQPDLARTLRAIAEGGPDEFYRGETARKLAAFAREHGGLFTYEDLASHESQVLEPVSTTYRGYTVYEQPPISQGHILLQELNIVEEDDLASLGHLSAQAIHLMIEAKKLAFADRLAYSGDPDYVSVPMAQLLSKEFARNRRAKINPTRAQIPDAGPLPVAGPDTTYLCVADSEGNAVSYIQSIFHSFGCGVVAGDTGVLFNNRLTGFSLDPSSPNFLQPGKRTMHTLNTFLLCQDGRPVVVGGSPGGHFQVQTNFQVLTGLIDFGLGLQGAIEAARWGSVDGIDVNFENRAPRETLDELGRRGHRITVEGPWSGSGRAQLIGVLPEGGYVAAGDPRWDYQAAGY